jgi:nicotinamide phosphoribosyltransferase
MTKMVGYMEPRVRDGQYMRFFGLQSLLMDWAANPITHEDVREAAEMARLHFGRDDVFPAQDWHYIVDTYGGGLPLKISAPREGTLLKGSNMMLRVESTDPRVAWLVTYFETQLERLWSDITVCTNSYRLREVIRSYVAQTHDDPASVLPFMLHDFGARGTITRESAARMGLAHLVNFMGTDTTYALKYARDYYGCEMAGYSIPAMEHSTVISWGRINEVDAYYNFIKQYARPGSIIAMVMDSYDIDEAITRVVGERLKDTIINSGAKVVFRPDSGVPREMVMRVLGYLSDIFGYTVNNKGYKVLNNVGVVQGDGVNRESINEILTAVIEAKYCASNLVFGMGGALLQKVTRDDFSFAYKPCLVERNHKPRAVKKFPKDDPLKASKGGDLDLIRDTHGEIITIDRMTDTTGTPSELVTYYHNGRLLVRDTLDVIRARS